MLLPAADLGLISSHLSSHDGIIRKTKMQLKKVENPVLKQLFDAQLEALRNHVAVMLEMIDPDKEDFAEVPSVDKLSGDSKAKKKDAETGRKLEIHLALEAKATAQQMAVDNMFSAMKMKEPKVKQAHLDMAHQQVELAKGITAFLKENNAEVTPVSSAEEQKKVLDHFKHMKKE
ncbi:hypothetical protein [Planococcus lenghuensis]|uniref:DUF892 family protein n=1 Tax=Planococcus lenghuensis TaxID=2213202 RepID=A0A1Q2L2H7_9BACL|nr:hypothetical protein [Planococcus lenghuensis]AQQ54613.1 hypothetical protein B0X71_16900 [Planococcus lenghuensis]